MEIEYFDSSGDVQNASDRRAILTYRVDYDVAVELLRWSYGRLARFGVANREAALKMDAIKLLLEQHEPYLPATPAAAEAK